MCSYLARVGLVEGPAPGSDEDLPEARDEGVAECVQVAWGSYSCLVYFPWGLPRERAPLETCLLTQLFSCDNSVS